MDKRRQKPQPKPENPPRWGNVQSKDDEDLVEGVASRGVQSDAHDSAERTEGAEDAITDMEAHEKRRDSTHRTGSDHYGIDTDMDSNAPKEQELPRKKRGGSRGHSDWD